MIRSRKCLKLLYAPARQISGIKAEGKLIPDLHEPKYLEHFKPLVDFYPLLNLQLRGYDFVVLEKYQSYMHKFMQKQLNIRATKAWATPHQELLIENLAPRSVGVEDSFPLKRYERNIQLSKVLTIQVPIIIDYIHHTIPAGVIFALHEHTKSDFDKLYYTDLELIRLYKELKELNEIDLIGA